MSTHLKNLFLLFTLISLCFLIKCKLDSDKSNDIKNSQEVASSDSNVKTSEPKKTDKTLNTIVDTQQVITYKPKKETEPVPVAVVKKEATKQQKNKTKSSKKKTKKKTVKTKAIIEFEELTWDFGEITEGDIVKKKFIFKNTGNAPLQILGADASCGCATPTVPFLDIAPGDTNQIGIKYNSVSKEGDQNPEIIIESNTYPKHTVLKLSGTVIPKKKKAQKKEIKAQIDSLETKKDSLGKN